MPGVVYTDPVSVSHGYEEVIAKMETTQRNFPGASFRNDKFAAHHGVAISHWTMTTIRSTGMSDTSRFAISGVAMT